MFPEAFPEFGQVCQYPRAFLTKEYQDVFLRFRRRYREHPGESFQRPPSHHFLGSPASATATFAFKPSRSRFSVIREARLDQFQALSHPPRPAPKYEPSYRREPRRRPNTHALLCIKEFGSQLTAGILHRNLSLRETGNVFYRLRRQKDQAEFSDSLCRDPCLFQFGFRLFYRYFSCVDAKRHRRMLLKRKKFSGACSPKHSLVASNPPVGSIETNRRLLFGLR